MTGSASTLCPLCGNIAESGARFCPFDGTPLHGVAEIPEATGEAESNPLIGTVLDGQYELREVVGRGASGIVFRARQLAMSRFVAVKILRSHACADPALVERFHREARAVARISHPNIVTVFSIGKTAAGDPYLVMEFVDGQSLDVRLTAGKISVDSALHIVRQITAALAETHAAGVIHRDLKPANILLEHRPSMIEHVKILDFGVAKLIEQSGEIPYDRLTFDGALCGTPHYASPEQIAGADVDHRADIYGVGVLLYRMLTGRLPFDGGSLSVMLAHMGDSVVSPVEFVPGLDAEVAKIVMRCLEKSPDARFASAEELRAALDRVSSSARPGNPEGFDSDNGRSKIETAETTLDQSLYHKSADRAGMYPWRKWRNTAAIAVLSAVLGGGLGYVISAERSARTVRPADSENSHHAANAKSANSRGDSLGDSSTDVLSGRKTGQNSVVADGGRNPGGNARDLPHRKNPSGDQLRRAVVVSEGGYSMRLWLPETVPVETAVRFEIELWDEDGEEVEVEKLVVHVHSPSGSESRINARRSAGSDRYAFSWAHAEAGEHILELHENAGQSRIRVYFDVEP